MAQVKGKIVYIEPNDVYNELGIKFGNGENINWAPEDLSISVDLQVITSDRDNCGKKAICDDFIFNIACNDAKNKYWQSVLEGQELKDNEKYLTTEYTDISYQEIKNNNAGGKESLGIQSIDISFDSHFFPIVKMKMIDVRGYSLMMPADQNYIDTLDKKAKTCNNFFSALFHFPYPRFALSVKGFYGDRVTFMLSVNDFQSSFNAQTGNFEVEIEFIGHMYGLYSDIPLNYLLIAPYIGAENQSTNNYWNNNVNSGVFRFYDGTEIPTFVKFLEKYETMSESFKKMSEEEGENLSGCNQVIQYRNYQKKLNEIIDEYNSIVEKIGYEQQQDIYKVSSDRFIVYFIDNPTINLPSITHLKELVDGYNDGEVVEKINLPKIFNDNWGAAVATQESIFKNNVIWNEHEYISQIKEDKIYNEIAKISDTSIQNRRIYLFKKEIEFVQDLNIKVSEYDSKVESTLQTSSKELNDISKKTLGFVPTIENIFRMIYAHIDSFLAGFYEILNNIDNQKESRNLKNIGGISLDDTDIDSNGTNDFYIPPFTAFYEKDENNNRVRKYPGEIYRLQNLEEVYYVEKIYNSVDKTKSKIKEAISKENASVPATEPVNTGKTISWEPLSLIDYYYDRNPYEYMVANDTSEFLKELFKFYTYRVSAANIITTSIDFCKDGLLTEDYQKKEVKNIISKFGSFFKNNGSIKQQLQEYKNNISKAKEIPSEIFKDNPYLEYDKNGGVKIKDLDNFPISGSNFETYGNLKGHNFIDDSENSENIYEDFLSIKNEINLECKYTTDADFKSGIYGYDNNKLKKIGYSNEVVKDLRKNDFNNGYFPLLQIFEGKNNINNLLKDENFIAEENNFKKATKFLSSLVGDTDLYKFKKNEASLLRVPKLLYLYFGAAIWNYENSGLTTEEYPFLINKNGIFDNLSSKKGLQKLNGYTIEEFCNIDENSKIENYFIKWVKEKFGSIFANIKDKYSGETLEVNKNIINSNESIFFEIGGELSKYLLELYTETIDIIKIKNKNSAVFSYQNYRSLAKYLLDYIDSNEAENATSNNSSTEIKNSSLLEKESIYYTLKNLYDKWISTYTVNTFKLKSPSEDRSISDNKTNGIITNTSNVSEFDSFVFIDTFYNDIRDKFLIDPKSIYNLIIAQTEGNGNRSCLQFMSDIAQKNQLMFIALPVFNNFYNGETIANIFTPQSLYDGTKSNTRGIGNTYVLMYTHEPSHNLNVNKENKNSTDYKTDGLDIADVTGEISSVAISSFSKADYMIPAFGVTFAKQNQMYFKGLTLNMSNPRETDYSIYNRFLLAGQETNGATNAPSPVGQNIFSIYSNRVYDCGVEMMGCANIMPLMYFQLNNVPMYRGAYRIQNVKHHIENGSMTTSFVGTRISKNSIPFNTNVIDIESLISKVNGGVNEDNSETIITLSNEGKTVTSDTIKEISGTSFNLVKREDSTAVFNVAKANYAAENILSVNNTHPYYNYTSIGQCATYTKNIIRNGFLGTPLDKYIQGNAWDNTNNDCRSIMPQLNFKLIDVLTNRSGVTRWDKIAEPGDVAVMKHKTYGHVCIYHGDCWVSDFHQRKSLWPYKDNPELIYIFRYAGTRIMPANFHKINLTINNGIVVKDKEGKEKSTGTFSIGGNINIEWKIYKANKVKVYSIDDKKDITSACYTKGVTFGILKIDSVENGISGDLDITIS